MRHVFIINPHSGRQDAGKAMLGPINAAAQRCGVEPVMEYTKAAGHARELAAQYAGAGGAVRLYAVGGDGTMNEVVQGCHTHKNAEAACVPCGSGNDFVRNFGSAADFLDIEALITGEAVDIDLMAVDSGVCLAITSTGLDAEVAYNIPKYRRIPLLGGTMAYNISIAEKLLSRLGRHLKVEMDGKVVSGRYLIATVCNGRTYGGGYVAAPHASMNDGVLEVILVKKVSRLRIASIIGDYKKGRHIQNGAIIPKYEGLMWHYRARQVTITPLADEPFILNVDGECGPAGRLYAKVMPAAARVVLPKRLAANYAVEHPGNR